MIVPRLTYQTRHNIAVGKTAPRVNRQSKSNRLKGFTAWKQSAPSLTAALNARATFGVAKATEWPPGD